jgi:hypothetical protein
MRGMIWAIAVFGLLGAAKAAPKPMDAKKRAYTLTLMCSVVAKGDAEIRKTSDATRKMAKAMGYSDSRVAQDALGMASVLGNELRTDPAATNKHRDVCRTLGLVG